MMKVVRNIASRKTQVKSGSLKMAIDLREFVNKEMGDGVNGEINADYLCHMTSISSLLGIFGAGEIFASHSLFMNDPDDCVSFLEDARVFFRKKFLKNENTESLILKIDEALASRRFKFIYDDMNNLFKDMGFLKEIDDIFEDNYEKISFCIYFFASCVLNGVSFGGNYQEYFVLSFSLDGSKSRTGPLYSAHAWGLYGDKGRGVAFVSEANILKSHILSEENKDKYQITIREVCYYDHKRIFPIISCVINNISDEIEDKFNFIDIFNDETLIYKKMMKLVEMSAYFKRSYYSSENEIRFIIVPNDNQIIKYRTNAVGGVVPYVKIDISNNQSNSFGEKVLGREFIDCIVLGSGCDDSSCKSISLMVKSFELDAVLTRSEIRFRG